MSIVFSKYRVNSSAESISTCELLEEELLVAIVDVVDVIDVIDGSACLDGNPSRGPSCDLRRWLV